MGGARGLEAAGYSTHLVVELCHWVGRPISGTLELRSEARRVCPISTLQVRHLMTLLLLLLASLSLRGRERTRQPSGRV